MYLIQQASADLRAQKFQRLVLGTFLLSAYILQYSPIVIFVVINLAVSFLLTIQSTPFYQLYIWILKSGPASVATCDSDSKGNRFSSLLGCVFLTLSLLLFYVDETSAAWILVLLVGTLLLIGGTVGFCLGTALYVMLFQREQK